MAGGEIPMSYESRIAFPRVLQLFVVSAGPDLRIRILIRGYGGGNAYALTVRTYAPTCQLPNCQTAKLLIADNFAN